jgi:hypothetical protein
MHVHIIHCMCFISFLEIGAIIESSLLRGGNATFPELSNHVRPVLFAIPHPSVRGARPRVTFPGHSELLLQGSWNDERRFSIVFPTLPLP